MSNIEVASLNYFPIKSCAAVEASEVSLTQFGIKYDREWMLVGTNGQFITQRTHPRLALVSAHIDGDDLRVEAPGMGELLVPLDRSKVTDTEAVPVNVFKKPGTGINQGAQASDYFSEYLQKPVRLLRIHDPRDIKPECVIPGASSQIGFADGFPLLLTSLSSLDALNNEMAAPVSIDRFRSSIVIKGESLPAYEEDHMREIRIGHLRVFVVNICARCPIVNVDQQVGELPKERAVTEALRRTRRGTNPVNNKTGEFFGQNLVHEFTEGAKLRLRDTVTVVKRSDEPNVQLAA